MKHYLNWSANQVGSDDIFQARVPGNVQSDYAKAHNWDDLQYSDNYKQYRWMEDVSWLYHAEFDRICGENEHTYFVSLGIDYEYKISINGKELLSDEGMYSKIELDLTPYLEDKNVISVEVLPIPKSPYAQFDDRDQANQSVKPAVSYGWDWHPRLVPSGMWQEAYIETRAEDYINDCEAHYTLSEDLKTAEVSFEIDCMVTPDIYLYAPDGELIYSGKDTKITIDNVLLWWCNGQGKQNLYRFRAVTDSDEKEGYIGFKRIELVMNEGQWEIPFEFPKSRSNPPITIELNGRRIFAKGTNWVNPEIFIGQITDELYETHLTYIKDANMNIVRIHGGTTVNKKIFYDLCDRMGIMVWQEFTLACNCYHATDKYMKVLEKEAVAVIKQLRRHASHVLWCGGNELFNAWSGMTDQSLALRLLNKLCFEHDRNKPFIMTSPLMGMGHGHYVFYDFDVSKDIMQIMNNSTNTAYTEFSLPSIAPIETLKRIIPKEEWFPPKPGTAWEAHCGFNAWGENRWISEDVLSHYFGKLNSIEEFVEYSNLLQCEGYKAVFGEARRQWPVCSMALNWDFDEPWMNAAGTCLVAYPTTRKPAYYAVKDILEPITPTARAKRFDYYENDDFSAGVYFHNDTEDTISDTVYAYVEVEGEKQLLCTWNVTAKPQSNVRGPECHFILPSVDKRTIFKLILETEKGRRMEYSYLLYEKEAVEENRTLNV